MQATSQHPSSVIYREALPVALATLRTINTKGAHVKGAVGFLVGVPIRLELRSRRTPAPVSVHGTVTRVYAGGARIDFQPLSPTTRAALDAFLRTGA